MSPERLAFPVLWQKEHETDYSVQFSSVAQSCPTLCDPMNRSTPGLPVHHHLPEFTQTQVHRVGYAIQPSHPLSRGSSSCPNPSQHQSLSNKSTLHMRWPKYWSFSFSISPSKVHPGLIFFRMDWLDLLPRDSQESSRTPQFKSINSSALSFLHSPTLTSIESVTPSSHLILCRPLLLLPPIPPSIKVFSNESTLRMR